MNPRPADRSRDRFSLPPSRAAVDGQDCPRDDGGARGNAAPLRADGGERTAGDADGPAPTTASDDADDGAGEDAETAVDGEAAGSVDGGSDEDTDDAAVDIESVLAARRTTHADATDGEVTVRGGGRERREVVVPLRLYKAVTVFSTLIAVVLVVVGFGFLDAATRQGGLFAALGDLLPSSVPVLVPADAAGPLFAVAGLVCVALGAAVYVLGSRFRTAAMGKGKDDADGGSDDG